MKRLLSLFDYSGQWSRPFFEGGWDVIQWDIKLNEFMDIMTIDGVEFCLDNFEDVDGVLAAVPCTDFTVSGAQYWPKKDADGRTKISLEYVYQVMRIVDLFRPTDDDYDGTFFWALENPVGRLPKLVPQLGKPWYFDPWEFAGYQVKDKKTLKELDRIRLKDGKEITPDEFQLVVDSNAYTKKTGLWGEFNREMKKNPIQKIRLTNQGSFTQKYGGKSDKTKEARSHTPEGFAQAFYLANRNYKCYK